MAAKSSSSKGPYRSAVTGHYVSPHYGITHPRTTVREAPPKKK